MNTIKRDSYKGKQYSEDFLRYVLDENTPNLEPSAWDCEQDEIRLNLKFEEDVFDMDLDL